MGCMEFHTDFRVCNLGGGLFWGAPGFPAPSAHLEEGFLGGKDQLGVQTQCNSSGMEGGWSKGPAPPRAILCTLRFSNPQPWMSLSLGLGQLQICRIRVLGDTGVLPSC